MIRIHTLQPYARWLSHESYRFDGLIVKELVDVYDDHGYEVEVITIVPKKTDEIIGTADILGHPFKGLIHDAMVIESTDSGEFVVIDYQDCDSGPGMALSCADGWQGSFLSHYERSSVQARYRFERACSVFPGWWTDFFPELTESYREAVLGVRDGYWEHHLDDRLFFAGSRGYGHREVLDVLREKYSDEVDVRVGRDLPREHWFMEAARHKIVLALEGGGPWCYREFEMFSLGVPVLAPRWTAELQRTPIPDVHYAAVEVDRQVPDVERMADRIIERHREAIKNRRDTEWRVAMAQDFYSTTATPREIAHSIMRCVKGRLGR